MKTIKPYDKLIEYIYGDESGAGVYAATLGTPSRVYFIQAERGGAVKIGVTSQRLESRLNQIQTGHPEPLRLIGWLPGGRGVEGKIHAAFADERLRGEWFSDSPRLSSFIRHCANPPWEE
jgi:hypothetical protein